MTTTKIDFRQCEIAIIGAGTAGCFIAQQLSQAGFDCCLIEKSRGLGGRCSHRRIDESYGIDLGAPSFSTANIKHQVLRDNIASWIKAGYLSSWNKLNSRFDPLNTLTSISSLCAKPSMNSWHKKLAGQIPTLTAVKVQKLKKTASHWQLFDDQDQLICTADKVIISSPPEQAYELLKDFEGFSLCQTAAQLSLPQYVCAIGFEQLLAIDDDCYQNGHPVLHSAIRETSKPGRKHPASLRETWVLHSTHEWAQHHSNLGHEQAAIALRNAFCQHFGISVEPRILTSHYWRLARQQPLPQPQPEYIWHEKLQIGCCGDWLDSGDIAGALNSSLTLSQIITHSQVRISA